MLSTLAIAGLVLLVVIFIAQRAVAVSSCPSGSRLPPGPKGLPLIGNLHQIPPFHSWFKFFSWASEYGPLYQISIAGRPNVIVSTEKIANDLLRERGNLYSSREQLPMAAQLMSDNLRPVLLPYNDVWRRGRKLMHNLTATTVASSYEPTQILESSRLLFDLLRDPGSYERWFERYSAGVILRLAYGKRVETGEEEDVRRIMKVVHNVERVASPGAYLVDTFPILMYLPKWLAPFKQEGEVLHKEEITLFRKMIDDVRSEVAHGKAPPSFSKTWLEKEDAYALTPDEAAYVIGTLFEAGAGTTAAAMMSFILAMVHYPDWQTKLQAEIDIVVGPSRLPTFLDLPQLPTVRAVVKETLRWRPVTAGGLPHQLVKDDVYDGFFLKAGTNVHPNQWAIHRDPELYPDPETFKPNRWLEKDFPTYKEPLTTHPNLQNFSAFGFGRRICPGQNIAERSLNILVARIAWGCRIEKLKGVKVPSYDYTTGFNVQPKPFKFQLTARSGEKEKMIADAREEARRNDPLQ